MALRINHNVTAVNGHRWLVHNDGLLAKSLEKLSSGQRINRASDGPAALIISEQVRSQVSSVKQAISNSEIGISMTQTAEAALTEVTNTLTSMRQLAISAANEGANDKNMLEATQLELRNSIETVDGVPLTGGAASRGNLLFKYDGHDNLIQTVPPKGVASGTNVTCATNFAASGASVYA